MKTEKSRSTAPGGGDHCSNWRPHQAAQVFCNTVVTFIIRFIIVISISSIIIIVEVIIINIITLTNLNHLLCYIYSPLIHPSTTLAHLEQSYDSHFWNKNTENYVKKILSMMKKSVIIFTTWLYLPHLLRLYQLVDGPLSQIFHFGERPNVENVSTLCLRREKDKLFICWFVHLCFCGARGKIAKYQSKG